MTSTTWSIWRFRVCSLPHMRLVASARIPTFWLQIDAAWAVYFHQVCHKSQKFSFNQCQILGKGVLWQRHLEKIWVQKKAKPNFQIPSQIYGNVQGGFFFFRETTTPIESSFMNQVRSPRKLSAHGIIYIWRASKIKVFPVVQEGSTTTTESLCYQFFQFLSVLTEKEAPSKKIDDSYYMYRKLPGKRSS